MKMKPEHFEVIKNAVLENDTEQRREFYKVSGFTYKRYRWDLMWIASSPDGSTLSNWIINNNLYDYLNDDHIDTALRKIVREF